MNWIDFAPPVTFERSCTVVGRENLKLFPEIALKTTRVSR